MNESRQAPIRRSNNDIERKNSVTVAPICKPCPGPPPKQPKKGK